MMDLVFIEFMLQSHIQNKCTIKQCVYHINWNRVYEIARHMMDLKEIVLWKIFPCHTIWTGHLPTQILIHFVTVPPLKGFGLFTWLLSVGLNFLHKMESYNETAWLKNRVQLTCQTDLSFISTENALANFAFHLNYSQLARTLLTLWLRTNLKVI